MRGSPVVLAQAHSQSTTVESDMHSLLMAHTNGQLTPDKWDPLALNGAISDLINQGSARFP